MKKIIALILIGVMSMTMSLNIMALPVDYNEKSVIELDEIISKNNTTIDNRSKRLARTNSNCIELIKEYTSQYTNDFLTKISVYTDNMKSYTDKIKVQKKSCNNRNKRMQKAKIAGKGEAVVKKSQIKYVYSQKKLIKTLKGAYDETKGMVRYMKKQYKINTN